MNNNTVTMGEFGGRLNLDCFTNLQKGITQKEFTEQYCNGKFEIFTEKQVGQFYKAVADSLQKGVTDVDGLKFANTELATLQQVKLANGDEGDSITVYVRPKQISTEKTLEKGAGDIDEGQEGKDTDAGKTKDELEKGVVTDSFNSYNANKLSFSKTGKEIKTQIANVLIPALTAQKAALSAQLLLVAKNCGETDPDQPLSSYHYRGFAAVLPKMMTYSWACCEQPYDNTTNTRPAMTDEMKACNQYNELVYQIVSTAADIEYCGMLTRNLSDTGKFELTPEQVLGLQF